MNIRDQRGGIKPLLCILLLGISVYVGTKFAMPYYRYFALKSEVKAIARLSYNGPERYKELAYQQARNLDIPITPSDIYVAVTGREVIISTAWYDEVDLAGYYRVPLYFEVSVRE